MDNSTNSNGTVGNTGMDSATLAGIISTAISFVALIVSSIQLLYQYYTNVSLNALGARNCNERVMGPWAGLTRRRWRWTELRFEIIFESPILFVAPAFNLRGPISGRDIWYMDGSDKSYEDTRTPLPVDAGPLPKTTAVRHGVNVEATWVLLLRTLQSMERESGKWQDVVLGADDHEKSPPFTMRTLAVAVQAQTLSWDFVPNFKKPFATTTMCHIVEMAAMLGVHWTMWDSKADRYRAEGNGCMLLGSFNPEQGIVFTLVRHDKTVFQENRLIPHNSIKRYCFGFCSTFYFLDQYEYVPEKGENRRPLDPILPLLKLGSRQEITETLLDIGCSIQVAEYFLSEDAKVTHLFPVVFDVLGMLGKTISVEGYCYRMLPNPTIFRWDRRWFDTKRLLLVFKEHFSILTEQYAATGAISTPLLAIGSALGRLSHHLENPQIKDYSPALLDCLRATVDTIDSYLRDSPGDYESPSETIVLETVNHHIASIVADLKQRPSWLIDLFPFSRANDGTNERNFMAFLFRFSRWAATHAYHHLDNIQQDRNINSKEIQDLWTWRVQQTPPEEAPAPDTEMETAMATAKGIYSQNPPWRRGARERDVTWCLLVFRMLCWLQLHDFHRDDVMIPRSATYGSRMPVYIT
ncbi:hypothetical protein F5Y13DRAFT_200886 [Hypoxylon sp. FL1857]|nr:hypothetical protein F5Y13DRAFT_200886 [Hypoxylon sp. FL1857]